MTHTTPEIEFDHILPREGSKSASFEELCCQLARRESGGGFIRKQGKGGDGGIECYDESIDGFVGWQAKYVSDVDKLITQATHSLTTALNVHSNLTNFILCFPFDLTGQTARKGRSGVEKLNDWKKGQEEAASEQGHSLTIEFWSKSKIIDAILKHDRSGGIREYFFGDTVLNSDWFDNHIKSAFISAGPRYTPELNVDTKMYEWFAALGRQESWGQTFDARLQKLKLVTKNLKRTLNFSGITEELDLNWPETTFEETEKLLSDLDQNLRSLNSFLLVTKDDFQDAVNDLDDIKKRVSSVVAKLARAIDEEHGKGSSESKNWRQFMMEIALGFPAMHHDELQELYTELSSSLEWFRSPSCFSAFEDALLLVGEPGIGKTHGACDMVRRRLEIERYSCIFFGSQFTNERNPWICMAEALGLAPTVGRDRLLDMLNAAGESTGFPLIAFVDAVNETKPLDYWQANLASLLHEFQSRPFLRLCLVCRTNMLDRCLPNHLNILIAEHHGFLDNAREACESFFQHFGLTPPITPILSRELSNPLYLRLVCVTLRDSGMRSLPVGWNGGGIKIFARFLEEKSKRYHAKFAAEQSNASSMCLMCIARTIATEGVSSLSWDQAKSSISSIVEESNGTLRWLIDERLLIEDLPIHGDWISSCNIRLAFERLGDFLVANAILETINDGDFDDTISSYAAIYPWLRNIDTIAQNRGILGELSSLLWQRYPNVELTEFAVDERSHMELSGIVVDSLVYREVESLTDTTRTLIRETIADPKRRDHALDALVSCGWRTSEIDAIWTHEILSEMSMFSRDSFWSPYLHSRYESENSSVRALIFSVFELLRENIGLELAERWVTFLLWFTAASDRRVKDNATRTATKLLTVRPEVIPRIVERFIDVNDDEVRERSLLTCYGALLLSRERLSASQTADFLVSKFKSKSSNFNSALIRDHIRCICELAARLTGNDDERSQPHIFTTNRVSSDWPLMLPRDIEVEKWQKMLRFGPNEFTSDFFIYTMSDLDQWCTGMSRVNMAKWIAQRVVKDFRLFGSGRSRL